MDAPLSPSAPAVLRRRGALGRLDGRARPDDAAQAARPGDADLVARAAAGDRDAFAELYRTHHAALHRFALLHVGDGGEDVVAETFLRAWSALPRYRSGGAPFVGWLYGIAKHVVADELRRRRRTAPSASVAERATEAAHDRVALDDAVRRLPRDQRAVIELKYFVGLRNDEVAAVLRKSAGAVNAQQWRALRALERALEAR